MQLNATYHWLVTGGAGFIGSHLVKELVRQGQRVTVLDNLSAGSTENLASVREKIRFIQADICCFDDIKNACQGIDFILHHAAIVSVVQSMSFPHQTTEVNVGGTLNVLEAARLNGVKRVVFASSCAVYGNRPELPYKETTPADCQSPYAWSKFAAAALCQLYTQLYHLPTVVLRYFNVYGPGQNAQSAYGAVIAKFLQAARQNQPLTIDWDGLQKRDFIHVHDIAQANLIAALSAAPGETYNVAGGHSYSILELADTLEQIVGHPLKKNFSQKRAGDIHDSAADISKITVLGFTPTLSLQDGLRQLWEETK